MEFCKNKKYGNFALFQVKGMILEITDSIDKNELRIEMKSMESESEYIHTVK